MPWKNQGGGPWGSGPKGPWGSGPQPVGPRPPDLEDLLRRAQDWLQQLLKPVLAAAQKIFKIGRPRPRRLRAGAPWPLRTGAPRASALILPRHRQSPPRAEAKAPGLTTSHLHGLIGDRPGPYNAACWPAGAMLEPEFVNANIN